MKLNHYRIATLVMAIVCMTSTLRLHSQNFTTKQHITIGLDANYAPLQSVDKDGLPHGYDVDFTRVLMKRMGVKFYYVPNPWNKVATDVLNGETDLAMMVYSPYRKDSICYSRPIFRLYYQVVYRKADYKNFDFRNLKGKTFAFLDSRPIGELMKREGGIGVHVVDLEQTFLDLANGKYDAIICYRYQAKYFINYYHLDQLQAEEISLQPREYCYVGHDQRLIDAISNEITKMEAEGIIDDIYGKDIKNDFDNKIPMWVWYLFTSLGIVFVLLYIFLLYRSQRRLKIANAMLETNYKILEMSHMELVETNRQLIEATAKAEESSMMKSNFIKQISHEIRTPLNILSGFTQIITTPGIELEDSEKTNINNGIIENTDRITGLVNKMLELSDASSRSVIERTDDTTATEIVNNAVANSSLTDNKDINLEVAIEPKAGMRSLKTNLDSAVRALELLLDNAHKFTAKLPERRIKISVNATSSAIEIAVEDNGIGIPTKEAEHIFEEFVQLDEFYEGTGIGLTVARSLARRLGGDITLDTHFTLGARFIFTLPR